MTGTVLISVLLPYRNAAATIDAAIHSILGQSHRHLEVLAMNDGSTDDSRARVEALAARDPRLRMIGDDRGLGLVRRLNDGIDQASGPIIARMDADDVSHPRRFEAQLKVLDADPSIDLVGTSVVVLDGDEPRGVRRLPERHADIVADSWIGIHVVHPTYCGRAEWFRRHRYAPFDRVEDQELLLRAAPTSRFANVPTPLLGYREPARATVRSRRRNRRGIVRLHTGRLAATALLFRDIAARLMERSSPRGLEPMTPAERDAWRELARSGRWPDRDSRS